MKKVIAICVLVICLLMFCGCVTTTWDEDALKYTRIGGKEQIQGLSIKTNPDGSFEIVLENAEGDSEKSFASFMDTLGDLAKIGKSMVGP